MPGAFCSLTYITDQIQPRCEGAISFAIIKYAFAKLQSRISLLFPQFQVKSTYALIITESIQILWL